MRIAFTGHRPDKLPGGYDLDSPLNEKIVLKFYHAISDIAREHKQEPTIISGGR
jgi:hypothetical protein